MKRTSRQKATAQLYLIHQPSSQCFHQYWRGDAHGMTQNIVKAQAYKPEDYELPDTLTAANRRKWGGKADWVVYPLYGKQLIDRAEQQIADTREEINAERVRLQGNRSEKQRAFIYDTIHNKKEYIAELEAMILAERSRGK